MSSASQRSAPSLRSPAQRRGDPACQAPEPRVDPRPAENPGGADALDETPEDFPLATPDPPISAQLTDEAVPGPVREAEQHRDEEKASPQDEPTEPPA